MGDELDVSVYVIILNWNGKKYLKECIPSVIKTIYPNFKIILVDNCSIDGSQEWVKKEFPEIILIENKENLGFVKGNNVGIKFAVREGAKYIALLNNDTIVTPMWLHYLMEKLSEDTKTAMVCSKIFLYDNPELINSAGGGMTLLGFGYDKGLYNLDNDQFNSEKYVLFPCAAAMVFRASIINDVGLMDERYFIYSDDVEWGWRAWIYGYNVKYEPRSVVFHKFSATMGVQSPKKLYLGMRNSICSILKNYEFKTLIKWSPILIKDYTFIFISQIKSQKTIKQRLIMLHYILKLISWNLIHFPGTFKRRITTQRCRRIKDSHLFDMGLVDTNSFVSVMIPDYKIMNEKNISNEIGSVLDLTKESSQLGYGWYPPEVFSIDNRIGRWTQREAVFFINRNSNKKLKVECFAPIDAIGENMDISIRIHNLNCDRLISYDLTLDSNVPMKLEVNISPLKEGILKAVITIRNTWEPKKIFKTQDSREMGVMILDAKTSIN